MYFIATNKLYPGNEQMKKWGQEISYFCCLFPKSPPPHRSLGIHLSTSWTARRGKKKCLGSEKEECDRAWESQRHGGHQSIAWLLLKQASTVGPLQEQQSSPAIRLPIRAWMLEKKCVGFHPEPGALQGSWSCCFPLDIQRYSVTSATIQCTVTVHFNN